MLFRRVNLEATLFYNRDYLEGSGLIGHEPGESDGMEFTMEFIIGFNDKVLDEGDIDVVMEGKVLNVKRTVSGFAEDCRLEGLKW